jgi:hypothetical protein
MEPKASKAYFKFKIALGINEVCILAGINIPINPHCCGVIVTGVRQ